ncbi:helix-turn-helix transcriptional regulator [Methanocella conradii]|uniref:helix-turn-helix transcriptional regulator n=1 Tax=Methanocella conradii TaxID=1175444 RepID=UPI00157D4BF3|nr:winged helix-turn-helix domain-containing protein [Methanocella conradii]
MTSDSLLTFILSSGVRKGLVFQLLEEPRSLKELKENLSISSSNIIPRIKELENKNLIVKDNGKYRLTFTGAIVAKKIQMAENLTLLLECNGWFLNEHDLTSIPENMIWRIDELEKCRIAENRIEDTAAVHNVIFDNLIKSKSIIGISPIFNSTYPDFFLSFARQNNTVSIILTERILKKVEEEYSDVLQAYLECDNARLYVIDDVRLALVVTDIFLALALPHKNGPLDTQSCLVSFEKSALQGGVELFEYYKQRSKEIKR